MSKRKKQKKRRPRTWHPHGSKPTSASPLQIDWPSINRLKVINLIIGSFVFPAWVYAKPAMEASARLSPLVKNTFYALGFSLSLISTFQIMLFWRVHAIARNKSSLTSAELRQLKNIPRWQVVISIIALSVAVMPLLYLSGFTLRVATLINLYLPNVGQQFGMACSYLLTIAVSGVIGNFAYDLLKRLMNKIYRGGSR